MNHSNTLSEENFGTVAECNGALGKLKLNINKFHKLMFNFSSH